MCHSRENWNPDPTGSPVKLGMTKNVSFPPHFCHSRVSGNPVRMDPQSEALRFRLRMTGGTGSPIRSASLSVEDDKECVIPVKTGIQAGLDPASSAG